MHLRARALALLACGLGLLVAARAGAGDYAARFDEADRALNDGQGYSALPNDEGWLAWGESYILNGYVEMYRATRDRRYLDSLVDHFDRLLKGRDDVRGRQDVVRRRILPGWGSSRYSAGKWKVWAVHTGMICRGPVDFIKLVRSDHRLRRDYGERADEYLKRITECVDAFDGEWRSGPAPEEGYYTDPDVKALPLNQQNALGIVHLALYQLTGEKRHYYRVRRLAYYMRNRLRHTAAGAAEWSYNPKPDASGKDSEDISHAGINIEFAFRCSEAQIVFDPQDLVAFGQAWLRVRRGPGEWADRVDGSGRSNTYIPGCFGGWLALARTERGIYDDARTVFNVPDRKTRTGPIMFALARMERWQRYFDPRGRGAAGAPASP